MTSTNENAKSIMAVAAGIATVTRPFYGPFFFLYGVVLLGFVIIRRRVDLKKSGGRYFKIAVIYFLILVPQVLTIYIHENRLALTGREADDWKKIHLKEGMYTYKYETLVARQEDPRLNYININRYNLLHGVTKQSDLYRLILEDWLGTIKMITFKTVGLFQSFDWSVYRISNSLRPLHPVFLFGGIHFFFFVFSCIEVLKMIFNKNKNCFSNWMAVQIFCILHVLVYAILTVPESGFIAPVIPAIIVIGVL
ncbi:MAG: hypothetical protein FJ112_03510, partial [Deltaproteobacteria bacterium]|nr:hypothetical protein [Deltaproteobacteria bacterium]